MLGIRLNQDLPMRGEQPATATQPAVTRFHNLSLRVPSSFKVLIICLFVCEGHVIEFMGTRDQLTAVVLSL